MSSRESENRDDDGIDDNGENDDAVDVVDDKAECTLWMHPTSDVLARVRAFGAFSYFTTTAYKRSKKANGCSTGKEEAAVAFCESKGLHHPTLCRCLELFKQLGHICRMHLSTADKHAKVDFEALPPPSEIQETGNFFCLIFIYFLKTLFILMYVAFTLRL
jgi:hypothetical protein